MKMRHFGKWLAAALLSFALICVSTPAASAMPMAPAQPTQNCKPDWVNVFTLTGQSVGGWESRVVGTDLPLLVNDTAGWAYITIDDADGSETLDVRWDNTSNRLNRLITLNGPTARVIVSITNGANTYTGCTGVYDLVHRP